MSRKYVVEKLDLIEKIYLLLRERCCIFTVHEENIFTISNITAGLSDKLLFIRINSIIFTSPFVSATPTLEQRATAFIFNTRRTFPLEHATFLFLHPYKIVGKTVFSTYALRSCRRLLPSSSILSSVSL